MVAKTAMYKFISRLLIPLLAVWFIVQPGIATAGAIQTYRVGSTFYPLTASGALGAAVDVAMFAGRVSPWITGLTLGYQLAKFVVEGLDSSGAVVPLNVLPAGLLQAPPSTASWSGWTYDSVSKSWLPPAVLALAPVLVWCASGGCSPSQQYSSAQEYCDMVVGYVGVPVRMDSATTATCAVGWTNPTYPTTYQTTQFENGVSCPVGYSVSGSSCILSNSSLVKYPSDDAPTVIAKPDGTGFALDLRDPDNASAPVTIPPYFQSQGVKDGRDTRVTVEPQTGGGLKVTTEQQIVGADGTVSTYRQAVITGADGKVISTTGDNFPGGLSAQTPQSTPLVPTSSGEFPTDYNREVTQLAIRDELQAVGESDALAPGSEADAVALRNHYDNHVDASRIDDVMGGVGLPSAPSFLLFPTLTVPACHAIGWTFQGREVSFDICPHVPTIKSIFGWVLNLIAAAMMFQMLMNFRAMRVRG